MDFELKGTVLCSLRSDEEMKTINTKDADKAFKTNKKILDNFLKEEGFYKYKTSAYIKLNNLDILEYIELQKESHGSKTFTINYALIPLYVPHDFLSFDLGGRISNIICKNLDQHRDIWWDYSNDVIASISFQNTIEAIAKFLIPWFIEHLNTDEIKNDLLSIQQKCAEYGGRLSDIQEVWLKNIDNRIDDKSIINSNIIAMKLPIKMRPQE